MTTNNKIKEFIKNKRDTLSASSLTTYASILKNLYTKVFDDKDFDMKKFEDTKKVMDYLKDIPPNKRKTTLSALVIITNDKDYRDAMLSDVRDYNKDISKQVKTDTQEENWIEQKEIIDTLTEHKNNATLLYKKKTLTPSDLQQIQNYIILCVVSGMYISPRRSKDWTDFRIKNIDKDNNNFIEKNNLVFTSYKTAKAYGRQDIALPPQLKKILNKWISVNPTEYLFFDINFKPLTSVKLNQRLNKIFGNKKISTSMLRHFFLTDEFADTINQKKKINKIMEEMGSSASQLTTYVKEK
jgi:integrase